MKNKFWRILLIAIFLVLSTGCKNNLLKTKEEHIYTTTYPIEFLADTLYGENILIDSIYPDGSNPNEYKLTNKQLNEYSTGSIFIYNGLTDEKNLARKLINKNNNLKIIDVSYGLTLENGVEELWLSPSNFLMLSATVKNNLIELLNTKFSKEVIDKNYEELQTTLSQMDAELRIIAANVKDPIVITDSNIFKFLENYGYKVISLEDEDNLTPNSLANIQRNFKNGEYKYILTRNDKEQNDVIKNLVKNYNAQPVNINIMNTLNEENRKNNDNYFTLMQENIDNIKNVTINK